MHVCGYLYVYISAVAETGPWARCSARSQWTGAMSWNTPPLPPARGGGGEPPLLSSRLGLTATILTPTCGPTIGVREARVAPFLPLPSPNAFKAERGQVTTHGQRNLLSVTPLACSGSVASCPLAVTAMPLAAFTVAGHGTGLLLSRCARSPMTHYCSHMLTLTRIGNKAAPMTARSRGNPRHTPRIPRGRGNPPPYPADPSRSRDPLCGPAQYAYRDHQSWPMYVGQNAAYTGPGGLSTVPSPTWHQPALPQPGLHWGTHHWDYTGIALHSGSPRPQPLAWEHTYGSGRWTSTGLPSTGIHHGSQPLGLRLVRGRGCPLGPAPTEPIKRQAPPSRGS